MQQLHLVSEPGEKVCLGQCAHGERAERRGGRCKQHLGNNPLLHGGEKRHLCALFPMTSAPMFTLRTRVCVAGLSPPLVRPRRFPPPTKAPPQKQPQGSTSPPLRLPPSAAAAATGTVSAAGLGRTFQLWGSDGDLWSAGGRLNDFSYAG